MFLITLSGLLGDRARVGTPVVGRGGTDEVKLSVLGMARFIGMNCGFGADSELLANYRLG
ncbi:hypothetical protein MMAD_20680 [Mycolicibacterium madagascariense]|uniref:Uncharacterized protein n=1 Tax=Mycolicibacterium madagascariense TaxID=212765 RepID=A0A7I7XF14_9MYCO|nr:hypothetical protein MMAD_20680 [Mycolicibacterium madagascariense]